MKKFRKLYAWGEKNKYTSNNRVEFGEDISIKLRKNYKLLCTFIIKTFSKLGLKELFYFIKELY